MNLWIETVASIRYLEIPDIMQSCITHEPPLTRAQAVVHAKPLLHIAILKANIFYHSDLAS